MHSTSGASNEWSFQPRWRCCCERSDRRDSGTANVALAARNLAADVATPAEPAAQVADLPTVTFELFGMGVAPRNHGGVLGDPAIAHAFIRQAANMLEQQPDHEACRYPGAPLLAVERCNLAID